MLIITNIAEINAAFDAKTPRPMRDVMLEIYPDATEDCNGRFHAPYDGYICSITEREFKAGEFLPMSEPDDNYRVMGGSVKLPTGTDLNGVEHHWDGSRAQNIAAWGVLIAQSKAHDASQSNYLGTVGDKITMALNIAHIHCMNGFYGNVYINIMKDAAGNVVIYKGAKTLGAKGANISVSGKVKAHVERDGVKQTVIERPKVEK